MHRKVKLARVAKFVRDASRFSVYSKVLNKLDVTLVKSRYYTVKMNCTSMRKESGVDALECLFCNQSCRTLRFETSINSFHLTHGKPWRYCCMRNECPESRLMDAFDIDWIQIHIIRGYVAHALHFRARLTDLLLILNYSPSSFT